MRGVNLGVILTNSFKLAATVGVCVWIYRGAMLPVGQLESLLGTKLQKPESPENEDLELTPKEEEDSSSSTSSVKKMLITSDDPGKCNIMPINKGNFSDHIFSYATAALLGQIYDKVACVSENKHKYLSWMFENLPLKVIPAEEYGRLQKEIKYKMHLGSSDISTFQLEKESEVILESVPKPINLILSYREDVLKVMKIRGRYKEWADSYMMALREKYGTDTTFIGFHVRLAEPQMSLKDLMYIQKLMSETLRALRLESGTTMKSVFIIASDDMDWCQENLHKNNDWKLEFTNDFYGRLGQNNPLFFDFAVLSAVDVSVANSASSMSFWTSFFAGGDVYMPLDYPHQIDRAEINIQIERARSKKYHFIKFPAVQKDAEIDDISVGENSME